MKVCMFGSQGLTCVRILDLVCTSHREIASYPGHTFPSPTSLGYDTISGNTVNSGYYAHLAIRCILIIRYMLYSGKLLKEKPFVNFEVL